LLSYEVDGSILILRASGTATAEERESVLDAVRADAHVPSGPPLLLDLREIDGIADKQVMVERLRMLPQHLGPKLGPGCALLVAPRVREQADIFRQRRWVSAYGSNISATSHPHADGSIRTRRGARGRRIRVVPEDASPGCSGVSRKGYAKHRFPIFGGHRHCALVGTNDLADDEQSKAQTVALGPHVTVGTSSQRFE
jgi:hypothetical protein